MAAPRQAMQLKRHDFLAGAAFSNQKNRDIGGREVCDGALD
jgi:hypothetical protein